MTDGSNNILCLLSTRSVSDKQATPIPFQGHAGWRSRRSNSSIHLVNVVSDWWSRVMYYCVIYFFFITHGNTPCVCQLPPVCQIMMFIPELSQALRVKIILSIPLRRREDRSLTTCLLMQSRNPVYQQLYDKIIPAAAKTKQSVKPV